MVSPHGAGDLSPAQVKLLYERLQVEKAIENISKSNLLLTSMSAARWGGKCVKAFNQMISELSRVAFGRSFQNSANEKSTIQALKVMVNGQ